MAGPTEFRKELQALINKHNKESGSDTPDFILAGYLEACLHVFNGTMQRRDAFYHPLREPSPEDIAWMGDVKIVGGGETEIPKLPTKE